MLCDKMQTFTHILFNHKQPPGFNRFDSPGIFFNITWAEERGECLRDPEFFALVLSFLL